jgi:hypothetical protein
MKESVEKLDGLLDGGKHSGAKLYVEGADSGNQLIHHLAPQRWFCRKIGDEALQ